MSLSRRKFIKAGIVATVCAGLPLKSAQAQNSPATQPPPSSLGSLDQLNYYTKSTFDAYVNTRFRVYLGPSNTRGLTLTEVSDHFITLSQQPDTAVSSGEECFSLLFTIPPGKPFTQDTYLIQHDALGIFYMFVVPVGAHSKKSNDFYEAVVYRREQFLREPESTIVTETQATATERDIFKFRPAITNPPAVAGGQESGPNAPRRTAYPLTMAQSPGINGLRLGMTSDQVLALFPGSRTDEEVLSELSIPASPRGVSSFKINPAKYSSRAKFEGISQIIFTLLDGRVSTFYVGYDDQVWKDVDEFVAKFSKGKNLPTADSWEAYTGLDTQLKTLKCKDFEISVFAGGENLNINYVQMRDLAAQEKLKARRKKL